MPPSQSSQVRFPDTVKLSGLRSLTFCWGMGNTCAAVVMLCPGKATGIWMGAGGKPGAKASAGMGAMAVPAWYWTLFQHPTYGPLLTVGRERELLTTWAYRGAALRPDAISHEA